MDWAVILSGAFHAIATILERANSVNPRRRNGVAGKVMSLYKIASQKHSIRLLSLTSTQCHSVAQMCETVPGMRGLLSHRVLSFAKISTMAYLGVYGTVG